jgi:hypothetical protein
MGTSGEVEREARTKQNAATALNSTSWFRNPNKYKWLLQFAVQQIIVLGGWISLPHQ